MTSRDWVQLDTHQDGTACRGDCGLSLRHCQTREPGEVDVRCCDSCNHPESTTAKAATVQMTQTDWQTLRYLLDEDLRRSDEYPELRLGIEAALAYMTGLEHGRQRAQSAESPLSPQGVKQ